MKTKETVKNQRFNDLRFFTVSWHVKKKNYHGVSRSPIRKSGACTNACRISPFDLVNYFAIWV